MTKNFITTEISDEEKDVLISRLVEELPALRTKLGKSQDEIGALLGISRQTYSSIETKKRQMSWSIFLSLLLIFEYNEQTRDFVRRIGLLPKQVINENSNSREEVQISSFVQMDNDDIKNHLDEQAIHAIETVIMMEYARCNKMSGESVIKAFDGRLLSQTTEKDVKVKDALAKIKAGSGNDHDTKKTGNSI